MNRKLFVIIASLTLLFVIIAILMEMPALSPKSNSNSILQVNFATLNTATSDVCIFGIAQTESFLNSKPSGAYLQGSCCNYMDYSAYTQQINRLKNYSNISEIPSDPYNVSVALVKQMVSYWNASLSPQQNATLTHAINISEQMGGDIGYCCCECWAWYFHEGLLKYLILNHNMSAENLGTILYLEDCCGGPLGSPGFNA